MSRDWYRGKVVCVTGGGSGIGRASALRFAQEGGRVAVVDIDGQAAASAVEEIIEAGGEAVAITADMSRSDEIEAMINATVGRFGRLDAAFNHAGIGGAEKPLTDMSPLDWRHTLDVNLNSIFLCMYHQIPHMLKNGGGAIVNTASSTVVRTSPIHADYIAAKMGVIGLTRSTALAYAGQGIRVNAVLPGPTNTGAMQLFMHKTGMTVQDMDAHVPVGRMATPELIANAVAWLCSDEAAFITGVDLLVDGGQAL